MLNEYVKRFKHLHSDVSKARWTATTRYRAPHKPLLLLAVMDLFTEGNLTSNVIETTAELGELFALYWSLVLPPNQRGNIALPFFHMKSDGFWHLEPQPGQEAILAATPQIRSFSQLQKLVHYARLDGELYSLLCLEKSRNLLRTVLIETYFAPEVQDLLAEQGNINVEAFRYSQELLEQARTQRIKEGVVEEERYRPAARDQGFRRAIVIAYEHRCALCGLRMVTSDGHTAVDAAHIVPWSETYNDDPRNGMALCRLCHWTFDEGLTSVSAKYIVMMSPQIAANMNYPGHLLTLTHRPIVTPEDTALWPDLAALNYHRTKVFRVR